jgi:hypothetical protein
MIRPLTDAERITLNLEQPGARPTMAMDAENQWYGNLRQRAIAKRAREAQRRAARKATP